MLSRRCLEGLIEKQAIKRSYFSITKSFTKKAGHLIKNNSDPKEGDERRKNNSD
jgi:hypothetical protein